MRIFCDVDGVVLDLLLQWLNIYNKDYEDNLTPSNITAWETHLFVKPECGKRIYDYIENPNIYNNVKPIENSLLTINKLKNDGHKIIFVTTSTVGTMGSKYNWLKNNGFIQSIKEYVETGDKSILDSNSILVDDGIHNIQVFSGFGILFDQPYNRDINYYNRATNWNHVYNIIQQF